MERVVWEGRTSKGAVSIFNKSQGDHVHFEARDSGNKLLADVFALHRGNGFYEFDSSKKSFNVNSQIEFWSFEPSREGLGKALIALVLEGIAGKKGTRATIPGIENHDFKDSLVKKLGGEARRDELVSFLHDVTWDEHKLTLPEVKKQPWHEYIPVKGKRLA